MHQLSLEIPDFPFRIDHTDKVLLLGSCFSDEIGGRFRYFGFDSLANPFGTIFHPIPLSRFIEEAISGNIVERIIEREDVFLSMDAGSSVYAMSELELKNNLQSIRKDWRNKLESAEVLFVTFGTAWSYVSIDDNQVVANCHKLPGANFQKVLSSHHTLVSTWKSAINLIRSLNPTVKLVFTVSPVRHSGDGLIENNRSKANLILLAEELAELDHCFYFPSYELVIDVLRDHRYFKEDLVHPSDQAIRFVWSKLSESLISEESLKLCERIHKLRLAQSHRFLHPESASSQDHLDRTEQNLTCFLGEHPEIVW